MPMTEEFFPRLNDPDHGTVGIGGWLANKVTDDLRVLVQTPGPVERSAFFGQIADPDRRQIGIAPATSSFFDRRHHGSF